MWFGDLGRKRRALCERAGYLRQSQESGKEKEIEEEQARSYFTHVASSFFQPSLSLYVPRPLPSETMFLLMPIQLKAKINELEERTREQLAREAIGSRLKAIREVHERGRFALLDQYARANRELHDWIPFLA